MAAVPSSQVTGGGGGKLELGGGKHTLSLNQLAFSSPNPISPVSLSVKFLIFNQSRSWHESVFTHHKPGPVKIWENLDFDAVL